MSSTPYQEQAVLSLESTSAPEDPVKTQEKAYQQILKSTALVGGASVINIIVRIIRAKTMAILLGPAGVGLAGLYGSISDLTQSIAGMGINSSGVRQISEAAGSGNASRIARTAAVLRRTSITLGLLGAILLIVFSRQVSNLTFGNAEYTGAVCLLSVAVFSRLMSDGQGALIQGMRRIADFAKIGVLSAVLGAIVSILLVYFFREKGIAPSIVAVGLITMSASWWYARKLSVQAVALTGSQVREEASALLKLGVAFMASSMMMMGAAYAIRLIVLRKLGLDAAGLYQSAWVLGGLYVGVILQAMGADFYPRLTASVGDNVVCNRMVNEQTRIGLLLVGPGAIATLTFAPLIITLLYTAKFTAAVEVLRWICLGATLQVITYPIGFIILAKGAKKMFFWSEVAWTIVNIVLAWYCVTHFGLSGSGIAFFGSYLFHGILIYPLVHRLSGFQWSPENKRTCLILLPLVAVVFGGFYLLPPVWAMCLGILTFVLSAMYSLRTLLTLVCTDRIPVSLKQWLFNLGLLQRSPEGI